MSRSYQDKIVGLDELRSAVKAARDEGKRVVQCHGCFDIVHPGHVRYLEFARRQGDVLIVSLTGDSAISKGAERPYIPQELRAENLAALLLVDYVYIDPNPTAEQILSCVQPDVYVKGKEYEDSASPDFIAEKSVVERYGGRIIYSSGDIVFSSTRLIEQVPYGRQWRPDRLGFVLQRHEITANAIDEALSRFRNLRVLVVGDLVIDRYVFCDALGVAREAPIINLVRRDECAFVGGAAIVARHIAALGAEAFLLTAGGADDRTTHALDVLSSEGVETRLIEARSEEGIVEKTRFLADDGKLFKVDQGACVPLDSVLERQAAIVLEQQSKAADAVVFCDFGYGMITGGLVSRVLPTLRHNVPVLTADVSGTSSNIFHLQHFDLLCPSEWDARAMLNDYQSGLSTVAWAILRRTQARHLFVTLDKRGLVVFDRPSQDRASPEWNGRLKSEQFPAFAQQPVDRLGCGDALLAAATLSLAAGGSLMQAAYLGNTAAALEIMMMGNQPIDAPQLREWLRTRPELHPATPSSQPEPLTV